MQATHKQTVSLNHPAIIAHMKGDSVTEAVGANYTTFLVTLRTRRGLLEYLVTEWTDGRVGVQRV